MFSNSGSRGEKLSGIKLAFVQYGILAMMLALVAGLWRLQVLNVENFKQLAQQNRIRQVPILAPRGELLDRNGHVLVANYPSVSCFLLRDTHRNIDADLPLIARGLNMSVDQLRAIVRRYSSEPGYHPIPIKQNISPSEQAFVAAHRNELPELETLEVERRLYPPNDFAANLIGYVGELSQADLNMPQYAFYQPGDVVGQSGVEESYDQLLRGQDGSRDVIVDSRGREVGYFGTQHAIPGKNLRLTISAYLQRAAELALGNRQGAIVAMDPRNGQILAMVSHPSFNPNLFSTRISGAEWDKLIDNPQNPLMNKAIQAQLAPGSTFKVLMSVAGLQTGVAQHMRVFCNGGASFYGHYFRCDARHGWMDIETAIPDSCDTFFYTLAYKLGINTISKYAKRFGFGEKTGIDLPNEQPGLMPSAQWVLRTFHHKWYPGETISVGIGQGPIEVTPIQLARVVGGVASDGHMVRPHVVIQSQLSPSFRKQILEDYPGSGKVYIPIKRQTWMTITNAMAHTADPGEFHTAASAHLDGIDMAGKTGTAEVMSDAYRRAQGLTGVRTYPNVWFVAVVPRRNPHLVVVVLWEHGDYSFYAARIAARVVTAYVDRQRRLAHNLPPMQAKAPVEVGAVWSAPGVAGAQSIQAGHYLMFPHVGPGELARNRAPVAAHALRNQAANNAARQGAKHPGLASPAAGPLALGTVVPKAPWTQDPWKAP